MNFQTSGLIAQTQQEEKAKYTVVTKKLTQIIAIFDKLYGPTYSKKLIQTDYNTLKLTSFPSIILDNIKINHPLVKQLIGYVKKLDMMGDSSKFFLLFVRNLIEESFKIVEKGCKPTYVGEIFREIGSNIEDLTKDLVIVSKLNIKNTNTSLESKLDNMELDNISLNSILDSLVTDKTLKRLLISSIEKTNSFSSELIRFCKVPTGCIEDSYIVEGMVFERIAESSKKELVNGTSAIYNCPLDITRSELKSTVCMTKSEELYNFSSDEIKHIREKADLLNTDLIICSGNCNEIFLDFMNKNNKVVFKVLSKHDLRRIRECLGGQIVNTLGPLTESSKGQVKKCEVFIDGSKKYTKFIGNNMQTILLKGSLDIMLDEHERICLKALRALSKNTKDSLIKLVEGSNFNKNLENIFSKLETRDLEEKYVCNALSKSFSNMKSFKQSDYVYDIYNTKIKAIKYALDFIGIMYETEDYLIGVQEKLNIKPKMNEDWDEDH